MWSIAINALIAIEEECRKAVSTLTIYSMEEELGTNRGDGEISCVLFVQGKCAHFPIALIMSHIPLEPINMEYVGLYEWITVLWEILGSTKCTL